MFITEVRPRRGRQVLLVLDGEPAVTVDSRTFDESPYRAGGVIDDDQLRELLDRSEKNRAREKALYLLSMRDHSRGELERKLRRTAGEQTAAEMAARMEEIGLVNDEAYAARLAEELAARRFYPRRRILQELQEKGVSRVQAEAAAEAVDGEDWERAAQLLRRKYAHRLRTPDDRRRTMAALGRYGFGGDAVRRALDAVRGEEPDWFADEDTPEE